jgi:hypothetical protein
MTRLLDLLHQPLLLGALLTLAAALVFALGLRLIKSLVRALRRRRPPLPPLPASHRPSAPQLADLRRLAGDAARRVAARPRPSWLVFGPDSSGATTLAEALAGPVDRLDLDERSATRAHRIYLADRALLALAPWRAQPAQIAALGRRGAAAFDGIVLTLDLRHLLDEARRPPLIADLRDTLAALTRHLGVEPALLLVLTHLDHLAGFSRTAGALDDPHAPWAIELPVPDLTAALTAASAWIERGLLARFTAAATPAQRADLLALLDPLAQLPAPLRELLRELTPHPCALFFTGALRCDADPNPDLHAARQLAFAAGIRDHLPAFARARPLPATRRRRHLRHSLALLALGLTVAVTARALHAANNDDHHLAEQTLPLLPQRRAAAPLPLLTAADRWRSHSAPLLTPWLAPRRLAIASALDHLFVTRTRRHLLTPLLQQTTDDLEQLRRRPADDRLSHDDHRRAIQLLDRYLRLTAAAPADPCAARPLTARDLRPLPAPSASRSAYPALTPASARAAAPTRGATDPRPLPAPSASLFDPDLPASTSLTPLEPDLGPLLAAYHQRSPQPLALAPRDPALIADLHALITRIEPALLVDRLAQERDDRRPLAPLSLRQIVGGRHLDPADAIISGNYTRPGWQRLHAQIADYTADAACWAPRGRDLRAELRDAYCAAYDAAWWTFLGHAQIRRPRGLDDARLLLGALTDARGRPLALLARALREHLQELPQHGPIGRLQAALSGAPPPSLPPHAAELHRLIPELEDDAYHVHLAQLRRLVDAAIDDPAATAPLRDAAALALADLRDRLAASRLHEQGRAALDHLLAPPLEELLLLLANSEASRLQAAYCAAVAAPMQSLLRGRYPHDPDALDEIPLRELDRLINPERGVVLAFLRDQLAPHLLIEGDRVISRPRGRGRGPDPDPRLLDFYSAVLQLSDALYVDGQLRVDLELTLACTPAVHAVALRVDGATLRYDCSIDPITTTTWPGQGPPGAQLTIDGRGGLRQEHPRDGEWGLWRLLDGATSEQPAHGGARELRFPVGTEHDRPLRLIVRPAPSNAPLFTGPSLLAPLRRPDLNPPRRLFRGHPSCPDQPS